MENTGELSDFKYATKLMSRYENLRNCCYTEFHKHVDVRVELVDW